MRWLKGVAVTVLLAAPVALVALVAWPSSSEGRAEVRQVGSVPDGALVAGDSVGGDVNFGEVASYRVVGDGGNLRFNVTGAPGFDATLTAVDDDGDQLAYNDDTNGLDPQVVVELGEGEEMTIEVRELGGNAGGFTLEVTGTDQEASDDGPGADAGGRGVPVPLPAPGPAGPATTVVVG